jgi:hypothetical protein
MYLVVPDTYVSSLGIHFKDNTEVFTRGLKLTLYVGKQKAVTVYRHGF